MHSEKLRILYVGTADRGTCRSRKEALATLGHEVEVLNIFDFFGFFSSVSFSLYARFLVGPAITSFNRAILNKVSTESFDWVWVDKGLFLYPHTLSSIRQKGIFLVHHLTDDFMNPRHRFRYRHYRNGISLYHVHLTSNSYNLNELRSFGAEHCFQTYLGFDPQLCLENGIALPPQPDYVSDLAFIGFWRQHIDDHLIPLIEKGRNLSLWGTRWKISPNRRRYKGKGGLRPVSGTEYRRIYASSTIGLCFLNRENRNTSTGRSFEIPAIGTMLMAERSDEHLSFFQEGKEAEYFSSPEELVDKVDFYLTNPRSRDKVAAAGHKKALTCGYSYLDRIKMDLTNIWPIYTNFRDGTCLEPSVRERMSAT